jgi:hypothetical protein
VPEVTDSTDTMATALSLAEIAAADMAEQGCDRLAVAVAMVMEARQQAFKAMPTPEGYQRLLGILTRTLNGEKQEAQR